MPLRSARVGPVNGLVVDLYAGGPSGWSTAVKQAGGTAIGLEHNEWACATRAAIGHLTVRCDIGTYPPDSFKGKATGLTASPPCQTFSSAGNRAGVGSTARIVGQVDAGDWDTTGLDDRTAHVLHTGRWVDCIRPDWVCFEQVQQVQPIWDAYARLLARWGYSAWTGPVCAADYGTGQERTRSILIASNIREVWRPEPTHFRHRQPLWRTMAEAVGHSSFLHTQRDQKPDGSRQVRRPDHPAPTLDSQGYKMKWGDALTGVRQMTAAEALLIQDFAADLPLAGPKYAQFMQAGNAIPVRLAAAAVAVATGASERPKVVERQAHLF